MSTSNLAKATDTPTSFGNFDLVKKFKLGFTDVSVSKWKSRVSGLSVVHLDYEAPLVNGYFVVATEIFDDSGCPHTLEHLVFMGSEKYPYKGIIDHFANRGFSNGTNAWTDTDHTAYTVSTAGSQGFLQILPIYVDHILYPTMTKSAFLTEVHHINPKGQDSGVVYSEMQGRQNTSGDLMNLQMQRILDPSSSAYRSETGGLMEALRVLSVEQIRKYHGSYYLPHNLTLIVTGKLTNGTESLLQVVQDQVEPSVVAHGQNHGHRPSGWKRPFVETPSADRNPIKQTIKQTIEFPEKDESVGELLLSFMGPPPGQYLERKALDVLGTYLTSSSVAPLNKEYIETENPLCTYIYFGEETRATLVDMPIYVGSIPTEHIDTFDEKLISSFRKIAEDGFDMTRMEMVISRDERQLRSKLESAKGDTFSGTVISDFLYGAEDGSELPTALNEIEQYEALRKWTSQNWTALLRKYFIDANYVAIRGKPSSSLAEKLKQDEEARTAAQVKALGPEGLKKVEKELEDAKAENNRPIPPEILNNFPVPDVKNISWINVQSVQQPGEGRNTPSTHISARSTSLVEHINKDGQPLPFFVQYDHVQSDFVSIHAFLSLADLPNRLKPYITAYLTAFFSLPIKRYDGAVLSHEEVVNQLDNETVSYEVSTGVSNYFTETLRVSIKVEVAKYEAAVAWLHDLLYGARFDKERLQVTLAKIQQSIPESKRDGNTVLGSVWSELVHDKSSTSRTAGVITQMEFNPKLIQDLQDSPESVIKDFEEIRRIITKPSGVRFSVTGNILDIPTPRSLWYKHFAKSLPTTPLAPVPLASSTLNEVGKKPAKKAVVMSLPTIESSYVQYSSAGLKGFNHPEYPAVRVALEVLNATESYLWRYIRGSGLAYGAYVGLDVETGFLSFTLYRSSNPLSAYQQAAEVVKGLVNGSIEFDETTLTTAKSSIVYSVAKGVSTASRAAMTSFTNQALKDVPQDHQVNLLSQYASVTSEDVLLALKKHFLPLFNAESSVAVYVTAPSNIDSIVEGLQSTGFVVDKQSLEVEEGDEESGSESGTEDGSEDEESS